MSHRNRIERCFNRLKHFRRFSTRYDRRTIHFNGFASLAAAMIWLRRMSIHPSVLIDKFVRSFSLFEKGMIDGQSGGCDCLDG
ncbi:transposase [Sinorhizobium terangae]|uniref:Transposase n=1 Tax=Sinorhizobium terangae TaxID=110322 RepID=A0A6N7LHG1_SINTE|nr:transposase [Sinorhizobium terangae]